jgi:hypothetical protein
VLEKGYMGWIMFEIVYECWLILEKGMSAGARSKKAI